MKYNEKLIKFRIKLLDNLTNIIKTSHASEKEIYLMELDYLRQILFQSKELENLLEDYKEVQ